MADKFTIECPNCRTDRQFAIDDVPQLQGYVEGMLDAARAEGGDDARAAIWGCDCPDLSSLTGAMGARILRGLAAAVRRGDVAEARIQLDLLAGELGGEAAHEIELGWFSPEARCAA